MAYWVATLGCCALHRLAETLQNCTQLQSLYLSNNQIGDAGAARLQSNRQCPIEANRQSIDDTTVGNTIGNSIGNYIKKRTLDKLMFELNMNKIHELRASLDS